MTKTLLKILRFIKSSFIWFIILVLALYGAAGVYFCSSSSLLLRQVFSACAFIGILGPCLFAKTWKKRFLYAGPALIIVYGWYLSLQPQMDANWSRDVAVLPSVEWNGDLVSLKNIRNFNYRSETDFDSVYYDKVYDLSQLKTLDLFLSYWGTKSIAHTIMSFGFANGEQLAISIETRKEVGEQYSAFQGFFNKFEIIYVLADERDLIGLRVNHRSEDVYLYRLRVGPEQARKILTGYLETVDQLKQAPQFYNALVKNCTTSFLPYIESAYDLKFNWAMIANGNIDHWRYDSGAWGFDIPFEEFRRRSHVNQKVKAAGNSLDFSKQIREGLPSIEYIERLNSNDK